MSNIKIIFVNRNKTTAYNKKFAYLIANNLLTNVELQNESDFVKQEKKILTKTN